MHPVVLCDALTNTALASYKLLLSVMPKAEDRPATGFVVLIGIPTASANARTITVSSNEWFDLTGISEGMGEILKPVKIPAKTLEARESFAIFLDFQFTRPESVIVRRAQLCLRDAAN